MRKGIATFGLLLTAMAASSWAQVNPGCYPTSTQPAVQQCEHDNDLPRCAKCMRIVGTVGIAYGGAAVLKGVRRETYDVVHYGKVHDVPAYGKITKGIPVIGTAAGRVPIVPTTLGQAPFIGHVIKDIPVVGSTIAGPPNPILVGAVAVDTYVLPKVSPCGYTESSEYTQTDFNSPPRLRHYKNYLAPLPYTHPPVYASATLSTGQPRVLPDVAMEGPPANIE